MAGPNLASDTSDGGSGRSGGLPPRQRFRKRSRECGSRHGLTKCKSESKQKGRVFNGLVRCPAAGNCRQRLPRQDNGANRNLPYPPYRPASVDIEVFISVILLGPPRALSMPLWTL